MIEDGTIEGSIRTRRILALLAVYVPLMCVSGWLGGLCLHALLGTGYAATLPTGARWLSAMLLIAVGHYPFRRLSRSIRWFAFDGRVFRAKRLFGGRPIERTIAEIDAIRAVTFGQCGELEGRCIRFADGSTIDFALSGYSNAGALVDALERAVRKPHRGGRIGSG